MSIESEIIRLQEICIEDTLDYIYNTVEDLLLGGDIKICDSFLGSVDVSKLYLVSVFTNPPDNYGKTFLLCGTGTFLTFIANYIKNGYLKFFN